MEKHNFGSLTVYIEFNKLVNCDAGSGLHKCVVRTKGHSVDKLLTLRPRDNWKMIDYSYGYIHAKGWVDADPDRNFPYRIPVPAGREAYVIKRGQPSVQRDGYSEAYVGCMFLTEAQDTVYAVRRGVVVNMHGYGPDYSDDRTALSTNPVTLEIEHADGSVARYDYLADPVFVQLGDEVFPDTPLGLGSGDIAGKWFFMVALYRWSRVARRVTAGIEVVRTFFDPLYVTAQGVAPLVSGTDCTALAAEEMVTREMTRREIKGRNRKNRQ